MSSWVLHKLEAAFCLFVLLLIPSVLEFCGHGLKSPAVWTAKLFNCNCWLGVRANGHCLGIIQAGGRAWVYRKGWQGRMNCSVCVCVYICISDSISEIHFRWYFTPLMYNYTSASLFRNVIISIHEIVPWSSTQHAHEIRYRKLDILIRSDMHELLCTHMHMWKHEIDSTIKPLTFFPVDLVFWVKSVIQNKI